MKHRGILLLFISDLFFTLMAFSAKKSLGGNLPAEQVAFLRFTMGLLIVLGRAVTGPRLKLGNLKILLLRGVFGGGSVLLYFIAMKGLSVGIASLLNYSWPVFAILWSFFFLKETPSFRSLVALIITCCGIAGVVLGGNSGNNASFSSGLGHSSLFYIGIGIASALVSGAAIATIRAARQSEGYWELFLFFCLVGALITGIPTMFSWHTPTGLQWIYLAGVGLSSVVAQLCMTHALRDVNTLTSGLIMLLTPIFTFALGIFLLHEQLNLVSGIGSAIALLGIAYGMLIQSHEKPA